MAFEVRTDTNQKTFLYDEEAGIASYLLYARQGEYHFSIKTKEGMATFWTRMVAVEKNAINREVYFVGNFELTQIPSDQMKPIIVDILMTFGTSFGNYHNAKINVTFNLGKRSEYK